MLKYLMASRLWIVLFFAGTFPGAAFAQTEMDAIMMNKTQFCNGFMYGYSSWENYWEGTFKRDNENLGRVSTQSLMYMANYGITDNLNIMAGAPYIWTKASAGTMAGMKGVQDISVFIKWKAITKTFGKNRVSAFAIGGLSTPLSDYVIDFLPMSVGLGSTNLIARGMLDYQRGRFTITGSAAYVRRSNIELDRDSYYDTELRLTNEVRMPDAAHYQLRTGYRGKYLIAEAILTNWTTLGGFDITKNNMPFPSNRMNATMAGANIKYTLKKLPQLSLIAGGNYTVAGRNMGQAIAFNAGAFYAFYFGKSKQSN
ncbi:MAG TPA: transporter [Chitinophagaceae bacterium]